MSTAFLLSFFYLLLLYGSSAWTINILSPHNCHSFFYFKIFLKFLFFIVFLIFYTHNMNAIMFVSLHKRYSNSNNVAVPVGRSYYGLRVPSVYTTLIPFVTPIFRLNIIFITLPKYSGHKTPSCQEGTIKVPIYTSVTPYN